MICRNATFRKKRGGQWIKGKSPPGFGKIGPWFVTADVIPNPRAHGVRLWVNDALRQDSPTGDMIFSIAQIISGMSEIMEFLASDIIATGTPPGVGARSARQFLQAGDTVRLTVDALGTQQGVVIALC